MKKILFLFLLIISLYGNSQTLGASLDKKTLALGEVGTYKVNVFDLNGKSVVSAPKNELLPFHFEELSDSISLKPEFYERIITFQVFEEGKFMIPALDFTIDGKVYKTVPYEVEVINTAKKEDQINDIMNNKTVKLDITDYWQLYKWYVLGVLLAVALVFLIYQIVKYGKRRKNSPVVMTNRTLKELDALKKKKYIEEGNYRAFYVELIEITRNFLTKQYHIPADVLLTDDLIDLMKNNNTIATENEELLEDVFLRSDLVKFAKTFPDQPIMEKDWKDIREFVKRSSKDVELEKLIRKDV